MELEERTDSRVDVVECKSRRDGARHLRVYLTTPKARKIAIEGGIIVSSQHETPIDIIRGQEVEPDQTSESGSDMSSSSYRFRSIHDGSRTKRTRDSCSFF